MTRSIRIGIVMTHGYSYLRDILRGIRRYAEAQPRWIFTTVAAEPRALKPLAEFKPDGLIAAVESAALATSLAKLRYPVVNIAAVLSQALPFPRVGVDNVEVGRLAAQHFLERGLRHFAFVGNPGWFYSAAREAAFRDHLERLGFAVSSYHDRPGKNFDPRGQQRPLDRRVFRWLLALPKPVGIFTPDDLWGVQMTEICRQQGLRVPEDVAVLGVDDDDLYCELARPPLSSVIVPAERIGYEAAALLERMLSGQAPPAAPILLQPPGVATRRSTEVLAIDDAHVTAALRFIREHSHVPMQVSDVFEQVPVGRRWLERAFRKVLGRGIWEEIRRVHLERARRLLTETDLSIEAVATQAGFSDFRHLAVVFRKESGLSPTAYRRQMRGAAHGGSL